MIPFFRKIRKKMADDNRPLKYARYAIGEIVLVVVGILIALQINNWNENRKHDNAEKVFLSGIKSDLLKDKEYMNYVLDYIEPKIEAYRTLIKLEQQDFSTNKIQIDSLLSIYIFSPQRTFYPVSKSFQAAVAGNEINTYKRQEVTQKIIKLYSSTYGRVLDNGEMLDNRWSSLSKKYSPERRRKQFSIFNTEGLSLVLDDMHFHYIQLDWYRSLVGNSILEMDELLTKLDE